MQDRNPQLPLLTIKDLAKALFETYKENRSASYISTASDWVAWATLQKTPQKIKSELIKEFVDSIESAKTFFDWHELIIKLGKTAGEPIHQKFADTMHAIRALIVQYVKKNFSAGYNDKISMHKSELQNTDQLIAHYVKNLQMQPPEHFKTSRLQHIFNLIYLEHEDSIRLALAEEKLKIESEDILKTAKEKVLEIKNIRIDTTLPLTYCGNFIEIFYCLKIHPTATIRGIFDSVLNKEVFDRHVSISSTLSEQPILKLLGIEQQPEIKQQPELDNQPKSNSSSPINFFNTSPKPPRASNQTAHNGQEVPSQTATVPTPTRKK